MVKTVSKPSVRGVRRTQHGAAAVELALMTMPLILGVLAAIEFGRVVYQYDMIVKSTRDAVRILTAFDPTKGDPEYPTTVAINRVVYVDDAATTQRLQGLTTSNVEICDRVDSSACTGAFSAVAVGAGLGSVNLVRVQVSNYTFQPLFGQGFLPALTFGPIGTTMMAIR